MSRAARADLVPASCLFFGFLLLYATVGLAFHCTTPMAFAYLDELFDADVPSRIIDLTRFAGPHSRTQYHPLFVLLLNPVGVLLKAGLRALGVEQAGRAAAILLCATAGAAGVAAFFRLLRSSGLPLVVAIAWSLVFGLSASQAFFSVFPESWVFSTLALLLLFGTDGGPVARVAAGGLAFAMAITNVAAVVLARAGSLDWTKERSAALRALVAYVLFVLAAVAVLSLVQTGVYAGTAPFWQLGGLGRDDRLSFVWPTGGGDVTERVRDLMAYFLEWCLAAPKTVSYEDQARLALDFVGFGPGAFRPAGLAHAVLWIALLVAALREGARTEAWRRPRLVVLFLWTLSLAALHLVFGTSLFLYSGQWTFAVLTMSALLLDSGPRGLPRPAFLGSLAALAALQLVANAALFLEIARTFAIVG
jgi:hypothetical protein